MALTKCPECGQQISDKANVCPNCGHPIAYENVKTNFSSFLRKKWVKKVGIVIITYIVLRIISSIIEDWNAYY